MSAKSTLEIRRYWREKSPRQQREAAARMTDAELADHLSAIYGRDEPEGDGWSWDWVTDPLRHAAWNAARHAYPAAGIDPTETYLRENCGLPESVIDWVMSDG